jgi:hypothetical protein
MYRNVNADWKLDLFAWLKFTTNYNHLTMSSTKFALKLTLAFEFFWDQIELTL